MTTDPAANDVGLVGDGDEIAALREVEGEFGVKLDYSDADDWTTVGDVYNALLKALPLHEAEQSDVWDRFAKALCRETGIPPATISLETGLVAESGLWVHVVNGSVLLWKGVALLVIVGLVWSFV